MKTLRINRPTLLVALLVAVTLHFGLTLPECNAGEPRYGVTILRDVMVTMRDGIRLSTDIYLPTENEAIVPEKLPAILRRTPY
ncbi:unnamed protein product, partial [marine sediment metagenome]